MDMYQKRKTRQEKRRNNGDEMLNEIGINYYPGHMAKAKRKIKEKINLIDIIYECIDARMPLSSKLKDMEDIIKDKPHILVMTKKDLCDIEETSKWIKLYEEKGYNVILVDLTNNDDYKKLIKLTNEIAKPILEKREAKGLKNKEIKIGVVGIPNVGKSTLINKLVGKKVANTGNKPGVTKDVNWLKTKSGFLLLDTPGILWPKIEDNDEALSLASTATIKMEVLNMTDIGGYIISLFKNYYKDVFEERYKIKISDDVSEIFALLAKKFNFFDKEGEIDYEKVSNKVYNDLKSGMLKGVTFDRWIN